MTYWVTRIEMDNGDRLPWFQAKYDIEQTYTLIDQDKYDLRLCFEIAKEGKELERRAQYMIHGSNIRKTK